MKTRVFYNWMRKTDLTDSILCKAVQEMENGLIDANLGGNVIKKRVPLPGRGKSGSTRILLATNFKNRWYFMFGFEKNERANIKSIELEALRKLAMDLLSLNSSQIELALQKEKLMEICNEN